MHRDVKPGPAPERPHAHPGRSVIAVIGIDRYAEWPRLGNAVSDARAAARLFTGLGFEQVTAPILDEAATGDALRHLVTDELAQLSPDDSLVVFFAGHGHTHTADFGNTTVKTGCVIPVDGAQPRGHLSASWLRVDAWLSDIARLPPRHILVLIDACHSGVALAAQHRWRDEGPEPATELAALWACRSRRVITSALDDQRAMDGGPYPGHSLFTGCLIEAFSGGLAEGGRPVATGRELGLYLQRRVRSYPSSTQTPDFGTFELDDRGDIVVPTLADRAQTDTTRLRADAPAPATTPAACDGAPVSGSQRARISRVAIGIAAGAMVAVVVLVVARRGGADQPAAAPGITDGGFATNPTVAAAPSEPAIDARMPDARDVATRSAETIPTDATASPIDAERADATRLPPAPAPPSTRGRPMRPSPRDRSRAPSAPARTFPEPAAPVPAPDAQPFDAPPDSSPSLVSNCSKATFAAVSNAPSPSRSVVNAAMSELGACHNAGAISDTDYERYLTALVDKL
jgi:uncharacterized caspase-like protein